MKIINCRKCGSNDREITSKQSPKGHFYTRCKPCVRKKNKERTENHRDAINEKRRLFFNTTPKGKASRMWSSLNTRVRVSKTTQKENKKYASYRKIKVGMSHDEFLIWVIPKLEEWLIFNGSLKKVSLDRINNEKNYEINNLQLTTKAENSRKQKNHKNWNAPTGTAWCGKCKNYLTKDNFHKNRSKITGVEQVCKTHKKEEYHVKKINKHRTGLH